MLNEILNKIQKELKAPKNQYNSFGDYKHRSCEDILEAVKPLLPDNVSLTLSDKIIEVGGRIYIESTAEIKCKDENISVTANAREPEHKKKLDESQLTGSASSYARKYALGGLFLIDDTKDADTMDNTKTDSIDNNSATYKEWIKPDLAQEFAKRGQKAESSEDKPWVNSDKVNEFIEWGQDNNKRGDEVLKTLRTKFKVSKANAEKIKVGVDGLFK